jgi:hypothetical protein
LREKLSEKIAAADISNRSEEEIVPGEKGMPPIPEKSEEEIKREEEDTKTLHQLVSEATGEPASAVM